MALSQVSCWLLSAASDNMQAIFSASTLTLTAISPTQASGCCAGLTERQQLALAMEESKKAAAALQAKGRQASRQMDSEVKLH